ncbi:hypothetical protein QE152_g4972 [Popillia japonica]|uniref:Retroviral polymerase SH3-like domain-containing protein n=1 Tax=Popillia japonica TaxID=7064 RepID=A0AAW1MW86_POPJA
MNKLNSTPEEKYSDKKPDVGHLKIFGSLAYYLIKHDRKKLDATTMKAIFLGYDHLTKHYRLYCKERDTVIVVRDAKIDEETRGADILPRLQENKSFQQFEYVPTIEYIEHDEARNEEIENIERDESRNDVQGEEVGNEETESIGQESFNEAEHISSESELDDGAKDTSETDPTCQPKGSIRVNPDYQCRRSERIQAKKDHRANFMTYQEPGTYEEAIQRKDKNQWMTAINVEIDAHEKNKTWRIVDRPTNKKVLDSKWFFKIKENVDGTINKLA